MKVEAFVASMISLFLGIGLHEYAHAKVADLSGDKTARNAGMLTLNLFKYFDLFGAILMVVTSLFGFGIGWGRPAPIDPNEMKNPRWDYFATVAAGPLANFILACVSAVTLRGYLLFNPMALSSFFGVLLLSMVIVNLALLVFQLFPFGPMDGHTLIGLLMPDPPRTGWLIFNRTIGGLVLLAVIIIGQLINFNPLSMILKPFVDGLAGILLGI
jgi:Zn-dependent protease